MFTPPPSPRPLTASNDPSVPPPSLFISTPEVQSDHRFPRTDESSPKRPHSPEAGVSRTAPPEVKKRIGRRILLLVALLPATLILSASLRHIMRLGPIEFLPQLLQKRDPQGLVTTLDVPASTGLPVDPSAGTPSAPVPSAGLPTIPKVVQPPIPFPQPFDASLSANFSTNGCSMFFTQFLQAEDFRQCRAVSFLLNASSAFLTAQRNITLFNNVIAGTCNTVPSTDTCERTMNNYLSQLNSDCAADIAAQNPVVLQAQIGFQSYVAMRVAACLPDSSTNQYCYIEALGQTSPADIYVYALPLGTPVPDGVRLSCTPCLQSLLAVYAAYSLPVLSKTYPAAAHLAVAQCGGTFASVSVTKTSSAMRYNLHLAGLMVGLTASWWIQ
ncbi:hypothetical protein BU17DRAFT_48620 [Hysterangium stoloniferum]|nr:hypothetical protein BU17DRAFT_48620 [Hysterangium stoloniferum]